MKVKEFNEIPTGKTGEYFIKKNIHNIKENKKTKETEGTAQILIEPIFKKRVKTIFEMAFEKAGLDIFEVKNQCRMRELQAV